MEPGKKYFVHPSAYADEGAQIGDGTKIWHFCHISGKAKIGEGCTIGQNVFIADGAVVGTTFKVDGKFENAVDVNNVRAFMNKVKEIRG